MRAICTSASLQASTWVSPGFTLFRHSSPPFGSHGVRQHSEPCPLGFGSGDPMQVCRTLSAPPPSGVGWLPQPLFAFTAHSWCDCVAALSLSLSLSRIITMQRKREVSLLCCGPHGLLGPCFKTGWLKPLCQHLQNAGPALHRGNPNTVAEHVSVLPMCREHNGPAARRVLGASVPHGSCAHSQRGLKPLPCRPCPPQKTDAGQRYGMVGVEASSSPGIP